jgi:ubiquinone/menaquinone biosynthesis C-methylase UbiE
VLRRFYRANLCLSSWSSAIKGIDSSADFVTYAKVHLDSARVTFEVGDAEALPVDSASFDVVVSGLVLNFVPEARRAVAEMARVARPDGAVAAYVWDYAKKMELMRTSGTPPWC